MRKIFLSLLISISLSTIAVPVLAADADKPLTDKPCPCIPDNTGKEYIRLQIAIPGITDSCKYNIGTGDRACYYIESNLPLYIKNIYSFSIGIIAIIAVVMIMSSGLQWIMAAGDSGKISRAKSQITGAVSGLILVLCSYVILNTINPDLVKLQLSPVKDLLKIEERGQFCNDFPKNYSNGNPYVFYEKGFWGDSFHAMGKGNSGLLCGLTFEYGYEKGGAGSAEKVKLGECFGNYCASGETCFTQQGYSFCDNAKDLCSDYYDEKCEDINLMTTNKNSKGYSCTYSVDRFLGIDGLNNDNCSWEQRIFCPDESIRVSCLEGSQEYNKSTKIGCWKEEKVDNVTKKIPVNDGAEYCTDSEYANKNNLICCTFKDGATGKTYFQAIGNGNVPDEIDKAYIPNCSKITQCKYCGSETCYLSPDALKHDPCGVCGK